MASAANSLRICLRTCRQLPTVRPVVRPAFAARPFARRRALSSTPARQADENDGAEAPEEVKRYYNPAEVIKDLLREEGLTEQQRETLTQTLTQWGQMPEEDKKRFEDMRREVHASTSQIRYVVKPKKDSFWNEEEKDTDLITDEIGEDDFEEDDMLSIGHAKLDEHRDAREYARIAVWEMPLLSRFAKDFVPPTAEEPLRFRYTTYMGEFHPADRKVVVEFSPKDVPELSEAQQLKLMKLAGPRYNPEKGLIKMSSDRFEHQAQNKRYLGDLVQKMITAAKDPTDMFEDVPLDTRHHDFKVRPQFPKEWRITEERQKELQEIRRKALVLDEAKRKSGALIDGKEVIKNYLESMPAHREPEPSMVRRGGPAKGRLGKGKW
ncbi:mitochondrial ribosomal subunit protein-domain-containing protein [Rhypophila decipiens]|uniref:Small ribosomal subunit protein mS35 n=1 Tax=Rhypophila decipiens TaxID=261697 RepID=A0AAN7B961_9PEZI|nr:mitochondrial ribosomal subunit protein-domain-containing protein [Rhypophila decipiens]